MIYSFLCIVLKSKMRFLVSISYLVCFFLYSLCCNGQAQVEYTGDTILFQSKSSLKQILDKATFSWHSDSSTLYKHQNIAQTIESQTGIYIKNYGSGSLSSISIRGGNASQTSVLWHGVPLESPMLGIIDLSLISNGLFNSVEIYNRGNSSVWGSGVVAGYIQLSNHADYKNVNRISLASSFGNFGLLNKSIGITLGRSNWEWKTTYQSTEAKNDFTYSINGVEQSFTQTNAHNNQDNILSEFYFLPNGNNELSLQYWKQWSKREIPPTTTQTSNLAFQEDYSDRIMMKWKSILASYTLETKISYITDRQTYIDEPQLIQSQNNFQYYFFETGLSKGLSKNSKLYLGFSSIYNKAQTINYADDVSLKRSSLLLNYNVGLSKFSFQFSGRSEIENGKSIPLTVSNELIFRPYRNWSLSGSLSKNYRSPTLNDRFWSPGGNELLNPESGWSQDLTTYWKVLRNSKSSLDLRLAVFNRNIDNWIRWSIVENSNFFSPSNIAEVWSRGVETSLAYTHDIENGSLTINGGYNFIKSTNQKALSSPAIDVGEQLVYTPKHKVHIKFSVHIGNSYLSLYHFYTSSVQGFNEEVPSFWIGNLHLSQSLKTKGNNDFSLFCSLNNLWNQNYRIIERRPMPGRNIEIGLNYNINNAYK